ncbi:winged helix-turn-helix domain-containing protein [Microlunatus sp. Y2014]|uniref:winged helix-turn-helix domain-containing protein n=1 Tax=Microlunatus sp. Y2014 TaxID=3418488 RepID=UPI003DA78EDA
MSLTHPPRPVGPVPGYGGARWPYRVLAVNSSSGPLTATDHAGLLDRGIDLQSFPDGPSVLLALSSDDAAAVLVPTDLVGADVVHLVAAVTAWRDIPVIVGLAAGQDPILAYRALEAGARGLIGLPFSCGQITSALRHVGLDNSSAAMLKVGPIELDRQGHEARIRGVPVQLSPREYKAFELLVAESPRVVGAGELATALNADGDVIRPERVRKCVQHLRLRLRSAHPDGHDVIETVRGLGYRVNTSALD